LRIEDHPVLHEYRDIFPEEIPGLPPKRDIDFSIELVPRAVLVSRVPYRMSTPKLVELKMQLKEMLDKGYIRPSVSPWGCNTLVSPCFLNIIIWAKRLWKNQYV
jgi:hypothetical protein